MKFNLRSLYLYLFSFVGLLITVIGTISVLDVVLKAYVFKVQEFSYYPEPVMVEGQPKVSEEELTRRNREQEDNQRKRQLSNSVAMIMVGSPLYLYHWTTLKKEGKK